MQFCWRLLTGAVLLLLFGPSPGSTGSTKMVVRHFSSTEGLPVSSASDLAIDRDGFLWLATHDGLARFDGREFSVYESARFPGMGGNRILGLYPDGHGRLYALGGGGEWLEVSSAGIRRLHLDPRQPAQRVLHVQQQPLCVTVATGLHCASADGMRLRRSFAPQPAVRLALADGEHEWLIVPQQGVQRCRGADCQKLWNSPLPIMADTRISALVHAPGLLLALARGVLELDASGGGRWLVQSNEQSLDILQLRAEADGSVVAGSGYGLFRSDQGQWQPQWPGTTTDVRVAQSWRAPDGALWQSADAVLYRERVEVLRTRGSITALLFDADGTAFVTTLRDGFYVLAKPRVELLRPLGAVDEGNWYGLALDPDGELWLGSLGAGLARLDAQGRLQRHYTPADGLPGPNIWAVAVDPTGAVLAASYAPGLWQLDSASQRFNAMPLPATLAGAQIRAICFAQGALWLGSSEGAWQRTASGWRRHWPAAGNAAVEVLSLAHGPDETVWLGSGDGLWRQQHHGAATPVAPALLGDVGVRGLFLASDGALWAASEGRGLVRIAADDPQGQRAVRLGRAEGLPSNSPHVVLQDRHGDFWVNSNQGIFRISRTNLEEFLSGGTQVLSPLVLGLADGLDELEGNGGVQPAAVTDARGQLWFPTQRGVVRFDPAALPLRRQPPQAVIDGIDHERHPLKMASSKLPPGMRSLQLRYNAADLRPGAEVRFRYRLLPVDSRWTDAGSRRVAAYAALAPGRYQFEVRAGNSDGYWGQQSATLAFEVPAQWYETAWFRWSLLVATVLLALALVQWRLRSLQRRAARLDAQVHARTLELWTEKQRVETTLEELARTHDEIALRNCKLADQATRLEAMDAFRSRLLADVSHELRTPLMLVTLPLAELKRNAATRLAPAEQRQLDLCMQQSARLSTLVEQLVDLVQVESGQLRLRISRFDLVEYVRETSAAYQPAFARRQLRLELDLPPTCPIFADRAQLTPVLGNLLDNASKFAPADSVVNLEVQVEGDEVRISVIDRGPGFDPALARQLFERFFRVEGPPRSGREGLGIGLALARELVELHGGRIGCHSAPGQGATFWFQLPLGSAHVALEELELGASTAHAPPLPEGEGSLLLVEDHPDLAAYLAERLGEYLPVRVVGSAELALELMDSHSFRLLISDVVLPGRSGIELCRSVRALPGRAQLPVILISAKNAAADREAGIAAGASEYLAKPFGIDTLLAAVSRWLPLKNSLPPAETGDGTQPTLLAVAQAQLSDSAFDVSEWARRAHLSERQLRRRIQELTGQSPLPWLREQRLLMVRRLLANGSARTLAEAGARCGLENPAYLYRIYRARFGDAG